MPRLEVDKERFAQFLDQFRGDAPYQCTLVKKLLSQMPEQVAKTLIEEMFYTKCYSGDAYVIQHYLFKDDIHYATSIEGVKSFLRERAMDDCDYIDSIDKALIKRKEAKREPICGFYITKGVITNESREKIDIRY